VANVSGSLIIVTNITWQIIPGMFRMPMMIQVPFAMQQQQRHEFVMAKIPGSFDDFSFGKCMPDILPC
jgi:hypothetical protein